MVLDAINPIHGLRFVTHHGLPGFFVLSEVILCATGAEALYADMGHLGRRPITEAWGFVLVALILNYLGLGVHFFLLILSAKMLCTKCLFPNQNFCISRSW